MGGKVAAARASEQQASDEHEAAYQQYMAWDRLFKMGGLTAKGIAEGERMSRECSRLFQRWQEAHRAMLDAIAAEHNQH